MNQIKTFPITELGYNFIDKQYIPDGLDEYYLRNIQNVSGIEYTVLTASQLDTLIQNRNTSDNWNNVLVGPDFDATLVKNCKFYGLVRIGTLQPLYKEFHDFRIAVGIYNSTIISCDLGNNVCIDNVHYLSHFIIDNDVMIANVNELATTDYSKFGNGVIKDGEAESSRTRIEVCNENGGRWILPFNGMLAGDAFLWSKYRDDDELLQRFTEFTDKQFDKKRGYYGKIGERTVIKNCGIIKDVWIGSDAYLKGANKIKNVTINSDAKRKSQIGEGCELVNGIVGYGCKIFYGVKAVRFVMSSHSQLKYGARLINSFLGNNSTISCCEVLNTLIFPSHEQHHNNSFLCASLVMGQSNIAAGATIGSNHNSRSPDGEIVAGRGFWPGLCVSLKHNSKFASFTIIAKGDFPAEVNIPVPFSLVSIDAVSNRVMVMPAYWFMYNMYAMERNAWKMRDRDKRTEKIQHIEYDYLAPDTINEIFDSLELFKTLSVTEEGSAEVDGWENSNRKTIITKVPQAIKVFTELINFYAAHQFMQHISANEFTSFDDLKKSLSSKIKRSEWINIGGQLIQSSDVKQCKADIRSGKIDSWVEVHDFYRTAGTGYAADKLQHAYTSFLEINNITGKQFTAELLRSTLESALITKQWMCKGIHDSRAKDYSNPFRKMVYETNLEMNNVLGKLENNSFIQSQLEELDKMKASVKNIISTLKL
ncbi:DUF4954 family protein [Ferruginibacter sp. HRS2-29]|uniref:DUF4954 family protein n=1 Tax=Ferruginibacter sp. HRS2-29 TaxID=2487334 RepID=UPI0020CC80C5|nr:DUF4954 family protein [Ferruginibacter sp. HRS2-29]MCP9750820.1 DUF4954 family protein [Ferruginibacter sp. HRS2-29]